MSIENYNIRQLSLGRLLRCGHDVYPDAIYTPSQGLPRKVVFKVNKHGRSKLSWFELAISEITYLFSPKHTTAKQNLVVDDAGVAQGVVSHHLCYEIEQKEGGMDQPFYRLTPELLADPILTPNHFQQLALASAEDTPLYFLNALPSEFFAHLHTAEEAGILSIDYASLAQILATAYAMEEDDLHMGNFGFYLVKKDGKPQARFFKIDHDLSLINKVMSFKVSTPLHLFDRGQDFATTAEDIENFPDIKTSKNVNWPTQLSNLFKRGDPRYYHTDKQVNSFKGLAKNPIFQVAKWRTFYQHILIPKEAITATLDSCYDENIASERAQKSLLVQAMIARQAELRAVLFSIPDFRTFVTKIFNSSEPHDLEQREALIKDLPRVEGWDPMQDLQTYAHACSPNSDSTDPRRIQAGDSPLHIQIRLGNFRYEESMYHYRSFLNKANDAGQTPLDIAVAMASIPQVSKSSPISADVRFTMQYLLKYGAQQTQTFKSYDANAPLNLYACKIDYIERAAKAQSYTELKLVLTEVGEDTNFCLKFRKNLALGCIKAFIESNNLPDKNDILNQLNKEVCGDCGEEDASGLKYIRQLRTEWWIIRQFRGLYGTSSTQRAITSLVKQALNLEKPYIPQYCSFFSSGDNTLNYQQPSHSPGISS